MFSFRKAVRSFIVDHADTLDRLEAIERSVATVAPASAHGPAKYEVSLAISGTHAKVDEPVTIVVTAAGERGEPTGEVTLYINGRAAFSNPLDGGESSFEVTCPSIGIRSITARYSGDHIYVAQPESSAFLLEVTR